MSARDFKNYTAEDFLNNEYFRKSVLHPDEESKRYWGQFEANFPEKKEPLRVAREALLKIHGYFQDEVDAVSEKQAKASFRQLEKRMKHADHTRQVKRQDRIGWMVAASIILLIGFGLFMLSQNVDPRMVYSTGNGERLVLQLPDDSEVQLNANSKLYYFPRQWKTKAKREVWLQGEAFFNVQKKSSGAKFLVHAGALQISVLGTQFNARSRGKDSEVMLTEGKVELIVADQKIDMKPGDLITFSEAKQEIVARKVEARDYTAWKDGVTVFNDVLTEVVKELEVLYGVRFVIKSENLKDRLIQLSAPTDGLDEVLETLELLYPEEIRIEKETGQVIIF